MCSRGGRQPHVFFVPVSLTPPERGWAGRASRGVCLPWPCGPGLAAPALFSETGAQSWCCDPSWRDSSGSERSPLAACGWGHRWPLNLHHSAAALQHSTEPHGVIYWFADVVSSSEALLLQQISGNFQDGCFKCHALSVKVLCQWKSAVICYVYGRESHFYTLVCNVTRSSGFRISATFGVFVVWKYLHVCVFIAP